MTDLSEVQHGSCPNTDCEGRIAYSAFQKTPLIACPKMKPGEIYLQGQGKRMTSVQREAYRELDCPVANKMIEEDNNA